MRSRVIAWFLVANFAICNWYNGILNSTLTLRTATVATTVAITVYSRHETIALVYHPPIA